MLVISEIIQEKFLGIKVPCTAEISGKGHMFLYPIYKYVTYEIQSEELSL